MNDVFKIIFLFSLISLTILVYSFFLGITYGIPTGNVALIKLNGEVSTSNSGVLSSGVSSSSIISLLESAESNPNVEVIVLSINSPGGTAVAGKEVSKFISNMSKPVIAWVRELGTSSAYLIASSCDYIIADELSIIGSVGSTMSYLEYSETLDMYGVEYARLVSGEFKDMGVMFRNLTSEEEEIFMTFVNESYDYFINAVTVNRNLTNDAVNFIKDGRVFSGTQALNYGLIDELGNQAELYSYIESINVTDIKIEEYSNSVSFFELSDYLNIFNSNNIVLE